MAIAKWYADYLKKLHPDPAIALKIAKLETKLLKVMPGSQVQERLKEEIKELKKMPIKEKAPAKKAAPKKAAPLGPKAKLMKLQVTTLRNKAKKLGISDVTKRTKENLVQSIILGEARKKRGTAAGKKATAKRKASTNPNRQINVPPKGSNSYWRDASMTALAPGRRTSKSGKVYYERRANRSDVLGTFAGFSNANDLSRLGYREAGSLGEMLTAWADQNLTTLAREYFNGLKDWGFNTQSGFVYLLQLKICGTGTILKELYDADRIWAIEDGRVEPWKGSH